MFRYSKGKINIWNLLSCQVFLKNNVCVLACMWRHTYQVASCLWWIIHWLFEVPFGRVLDWSFADGLQPRWMHTWTVLKYVLLLTKQYQNLHWQYTQNYNVRCGVQMHIAMFITIKFVGKQSSLFVILVKITKKTYIYTVLTNLEELIKGWLVDLQAIKEQTFDLGISSACLCNLACGFWCCVS